MSDTPTSGPHGRLNLWAEEVHRNTLAMRYRVKNVLFDGTSEFQQVSVVETESLGRMLLNDGLVMVSDRDEYIYHDMITHPALFVHPDPKRVLVVGGGDGGTAREVLRHRGVEHCRMVEIDGMVVEACREHIPVTSSALDDPRLELTIDDAVRFVAETDDRYDVVLVDSTDPIGPATPLFGAEFYENVHRVLDGNGIVVSQGESPFYELARQESMLRILSARFPVASIYNFTNMTYPGGLWSFTFASKGLRPLADFDPGRALESGLEFRYYNPAVHRAAFALPTFQQNALSEWLTREI